MALERVFFCRRAMLPRAARTPPRLLDYWRPLFAYFSLSVWRWRVLAHVRDLVVELAAGDVWCVVVVTGCVCFEFLVFVLVVLFCVLVALPGSGGVYFWPYPAFEAVGCGYGEIQRDTARYSYGYSWIQYTVSGYSSAAKLLDIDRYRYRQGYTGCQCQFKAKDMVRQAGGIQVKYRREHRTSQKYTRRGRGRGAGAGEEDLWCRNIVTVTLNLLKQYTQY